MFLFSFTVFKMCYLLRAHFPMFCSHVLLSLVLYSDVGHILYINGYYFIFLAYTNVCSIAELTQWVAPPKMVCNWYRI